MKAALRSKDIIDERDEKQIGNRVSMKALSITISGLGENLLRTIQDFETAQSE